MNLMYYLFSVVIVFKLIISLEQIKEYRVYFAKTEYAVDTLRINVDANRQLAKMCKYYGMCPAPANWIPIWQGTWEFRG